MCVQEARRAAQHAETLSRLEAAQRLLREEQARDQQWRQRAAGGPQLLLEVRVCAWGRGTCVVETKA